MCFAQYLQPVPFPSSLRTRRSHRPLQLLKFNHIKTLPFWALMCRRFAELEQMVPQEIPGEGREGEGHPLPSHSLWGGCERCHLAELASKVTTDAPPSYCVCLVILRPHNHCEGVKKGTGRKRPKDSTTQAEGKPFRVTTAVGSDFW